MKPLSLYIHIPFCETKCPYCDFFSIKYNYLKVQKYIDYLCNRIKYYSQIYNRDVDTIYFGGGTPSIIGSNNIVKILDCIYKNFRVINPEITIEINPSSSFDLDFNILNNYGINRISLGMQTSNDDELKLLGRTHTKEDIVNTIDKIRKANINNISLDVMIGISKQTKESLKNTLNFCCELDVTHISAYILKIEKKTKYNLIKNTLNLPDEDTVSDYYLYMLSHLEKSGYIHYEISNFSKASYESKHNLKYWKCQEYLGVGVAAHSFIENKRFYSPRKFKDFYNDIIIDDGIGGGEDEYIMMNLRLKKGVSFLEFNQIFGYGFPQKYIKNANNPKFLGYVCINDTHLYLTKKGFLISNYIISSILYDA